VSVASAPWFKFYPQDWRADEKLRMCSLAARGLWMEMLAIMHRSERYGQLLIGGRVPTDTQLAVQAGAPSDQVPALLAELEEAGVFSRTAGGAIYSRRMTRDQKKAEIARKNGKSGGNPKLGNKKKNPASDKGSDKPPDKGGLKPQRPEAREQIPDSSSTQSPSPVNRARESAMPDHVRLVLEAGGYVSPPPDLRLLNEWYAAGATLDQDILPVLRREASGLRARTGQAPRTLKVFDAAIREKLAADEAEIARLQRISREYGRGNG